MLKWQDQFQNGPVIPSNVECSDLIHGANWVGRIRTGLGFGQGMWMDVIRDERLMVYVELLTLVLYLDDDGGADDS